VVKIICAEHFRSLSVFNSKFGRIDKFEISVSIGIFFKKLIKNSIFTILHSPVFAVIALKAAKMANATSLFGFTGQNVVFILQF
jgi:hypothetical protein